MNNILLGTTSEAKLNIIKNIIKDSYNIMPIKVDSGISDQPLDEKTTIQGAINRTKQAIHKTQDQNYEFSVGLEAGLSKINNTYYLVCVSAITDKKKQYLYWYQQQTSSAQRSFRKGFARRAVWSGCSRLCKRHKRSLARIFRSHSRAY